MYTCVHVRVSLSPQAGPGLRLIGLGKVLHGVEWVEPATTSKPLAPPQSHIKEEIHDACWASIHPYARENTIMCVCVMALVCIRLVNPFCTVCVQFYVYVCVHVRVNFHLLLIHVHVLHVHTLSVVIRLLSIGPKSILKTSLQCLRAHLL